MLKAYKYEIYPTEEQKVILSQYFGVTRYVYNYFLNMKIEAYKKDKTTLSKFDLGKELTKLRAEVDFIRECPQVIEEQAIANMDFAYQNFFKGIAKYPKFKNKFQKQSFTVRRAFKLCFDTHKIKLPKMDPIDIYLYRTFEGDQRSVTVSKTTTNRYYVSVLVNTPEIIPTKKKKVSEKTMVGVDVGIKELIVTSDNKVYENMNFLKKQLKRLRVENRSLARKTKDGKNWHKQKLVVAKLHEKIKNQRNYYIHHVTNDLVNNYDTICLEDIKASNLVKNKNLARSISDVSWGELRRMIDYKTEWKGKNTIVINRFAPSSQVCSECGCRNNNITDEIKKQKEKEEAKKKLEEATEDTKKKTNKDTKKKTKTFKMSGLKVRKFKCNECDNVMDRDLNASLNIKSFGMQQHIEDANEKKNKKKKKKADVKVKKSVKKIDKNSSCEENQVTI